MLKLCKINACPNGTLGIHLSRAPYDPYPWVSGVLENSSAYQSGIKIGDTVLECNGIDVLGWKISELAIKIRNHWDCGGKTVNFLIWRSKNDVTTSTINQQSLQKFATCLQNIAQLLECPICLEVIKPPGWQCCNGHVLCNSCRNRSVKCPVCRVPFGPRGRCLLSDKLFTLLAETFPCDGTKNGSNKNGRCPPENIKNKKCNISKKITSIESPLPSVTQTLTEMRNPLVNTSNENNSITTFGTTRIIKVGEEVRTSPIKTRNNQNTYDRIPQELTTTTIPAIPSTTFQTRSIETNHQPLIVNRKYLEPIQNISTTATTTTALLPHTTIVPLSPVLSTTITTNIIEKIEPLPMHMTNNISCMSSGSTEIAVNSNLKGSTENKLEKQIITLKVKSKSSENLNFFRVEKETKELEERKVKETLSLPASPVSNLVNSKKNSKITTKMSPGYETLLPTTTNTKQINDKNDIEATVVCPSLSLWLNFIQEHKNYHCSTGKSTCIIDKIDEIFSNSTSKYCHQKYCHQTAKKLLRTTMTKTVPMTTTKTTLNQKLLEKNLEQNDKIINKKIFSSYNDDEKQFQNFKLDQEDQLINFPTKEEIINKNLNSEYEIE